MSILRQLRIARGLSLREAARLTGIPFSTLQNYESEQTALPLGARLILADAYQCSVSLLPVSVPRRGHWREARSQVAAMELQVDAAPVWAGAPNSYPDLLLRLRVPEIPVWFLEATRIDSQLEVVGWSTLFCAGGEALALSPLLYGFDLHPLVMPNRRALGTRRKTCIGLQFGELRILVWPQVTMRTPNFGDLRVDGLVLVRWRGRKVWMLLEIDGRVHGDLGRERRRDAELRAPVLRFGSAEVLSGEFAALLESRVREVVGRPVRSVRAA